MDNEVLPEPATFSIEWYYHKVQNAAFIGRFYVLGKGDVYVFYSLKNQVSVRDVYHFGENVYFVFEFDDRLDSLTRKRSKSLFRQKKATTLFMLYWVMVSSTMVHSLPLLHFSDLIDPSILSLV